MQIHDMEMDGMASSGASVLLDGGGSKASRKKRRKSPSRTKRSMKYFIGCPFCDRTWGVDAEVTMDEYRRGEGAANNLFVVLLGATGVVVTALVPALVAVATTPAPTALVVVVAVVLVMPGVDGDDG